MSLVVVIDNDNADKTARLQVDMPLKVLFAGLKEA